MFRTAMKTISVSLAAWRVAKSASIEEERSIGEIVASALFDKYGE